MALRESRVFSEVRSAELYSMSGPDREKLAGELAQYDYILTLDHGENFGPLATSVVRKQLGSKVLSLPTPFFSGLMPDMAYLSYANDFARATAVLGDYHSGLIMEEVRAGFLERQDRQTLRLGQGL